MRVLLDTHAFLWMQAAPSRFGDEARALVEEASNELLVSAASAWEIAIKWSLRKLTLPMPPSEYVPQRLRDSGCTPLPVTVGHTLAVATLPWRHRDPFDRLLVAQAAGEGVPVLTDDRSFHGYDVEVIAADR